MRHYGKITAITLIFLMVLGYMAYLVIPAKAATVQTKTFILPVDKDNRSAATSITIVLLDPDSGNAISGTDGTSTAATTWDAAEVAGSQHSVTNEWTFTIPRPANTDSMYLKIYHAAAGSVSKTTTPSEQPILYDWQSNRTYTDATPTKAGQVIVNR